MMPARVLLVGNERAHLESRATVLHHFWEIDIAALDESDVPVFSADLVVLCHTIPEPERQAWVTRVRQQVTAMLVIKMNGFDSGPHAGADATVNLHNGPGALVSTIYELLTERGLASRDWPERPVAAIAGGVQ